MIAESVFAVWREEGEEFAAHGCREAGADADVLKDLLVVVEAEEERANLLAGAIFVPAESGDDAIAVALVLDFEHDALVGLVGEILRLGHDAIETGTFEAPEPFVGYAGVGRGRRYVEWRLRGFQYRFECEAALAKGLVAQIALLIAQEVEEYAGCWGLLGEQFYARCGGMDAQLESAEVEVAVVGDDEFAIKDASLGKLVANGIEHLGEVAVKGFLVAALEEDLVAIAKDEDAKAVPFGLVDPVAFGGDGFDSLGEHGKDGRIDGELHE
jgi:hypothetical protein